MKLFLIPEHISIQIVRMISLVSMGILLLLIVIPQFIRASLWGHLKLTKSVMMDLQGQFLKHPHQERKRSWLNYSKRALGMTTILPSQIPQATRTLPMKR
ncbi:hypothetical protein Goarm_002105 [Gossypium armourianum]|uniref:Uncharacterized protein n=1 Tax=Gossypium armourianum TaxID=34283 RepID=A0A7J9K7M2_9ROSI|nr:hypothetical protein [Gossypium armourianum]